MDLCLSGLFLKACEIQKASRAAFEHNYSSFQLFTRSQQKPEKKGNQSNPEQKRAGRAAGSLSLF